MRNVSLMVRSPLRRSGAVLAYVLSAMSPGVATAQTGPAHGTGHPSGAIPSNSVEPLTAGATSGEAAQATGIDRTEQRAAQDEPAGNGEIVVTGSRIVRDGGRAPTPTTVLSREEIQQRNPANIADYVQQLPSLGIGNSTRTTTHGSLEVCQ